MKIVIATPVLYRETSPFNHLFKDIIGGFLEDGNQVIRLVAVEDETQKEFKYGYMGPNIEYKLFKRKNCERSNIMSRYIRDTLTNIRQAMTILRLKNVDILFEDVSYSSFWVVKAAKLKGIKVVAMLQDVWPDNAVQSNLISKNSVLYKYFEFWQKSVYKNADRIICISDDIKKFISRKNINENKIEVIYNWGYSDDIVDISWDKNEFVKKFNLDKEKKYVIYAGNIGKMQNVEIVVNAAKVLQNREDIVFLIIGDGAKKTEIKEMLNNSKNVIMLPMQPSELALHIYSAASVNLIPLVTGGTKTALPSKTGVVLSCGRPTIFTFGEDSYFSYILNKYNAGKSVSSNSAEQLANSIIETVDNNKNFKKEDVYRLFNDLFLKKQNVLKYVDVMNEVMKIDN